MWNKSKSRLDSYTIFAAGFLVIAAMVVHVWLIFHYDFTQDDAYITFRYAQNFIDGHGLVYNIGERVEGYTNFLWTILIIAGHRLGIGFVILSRVLGTVFGLATIVLLFAMARHVFRDVSGPARHILPGISCLLLGAVYSFAYWAAAGLETTVFAFFVLLAVYCATRRHYLIIPAMVIATLLRPEGGLVFFFLVLYDLAVRRSWDRYLGTTVIFYVVLLLPFLVFKLTYYGSILPNTFYAKTSFSAEQVRYGLVYAWLFARHYLGYGLFVLPVFFAVRRAPAVIRLCLIFTAVNTFYIILMGGDVLKVHRFFVPLFPLLIMVMVYSLHAVLKKPYLYIPGLVLLLAGQMILPRGHVAEFHRAEVGLAAKMNGIMDRLLAADSTDFSLSASTIGLVGYRLTGHTVIDMLGLTDSTIARHPEPAIAGMETSWREAHFNSRHLLTHQPDYILFSTGFKPSAPAERALFLHSAFLKSYRAIGFPYAGNMHSIFKRFLPVTGDIKRDIDVRFVQNFNRGINLVMRDGKYSESLAAFSEARRFLSDTTYPYLNYYASIAYGRMGQIERQRTLLMKIADRDTLVYEAYLGLGIYACAEGNAENFRLFRDRLSRLTPWNVHRLDSLCAPAWKQK